MLKETNINETQTGSNIFYNLTRMLSIGFLLPVQRSYSMDYMEKIYPRNW